MVVYLYTVRYVWQHLASCMNMTKEIKSFQAIIWLTRNHIINSAIDSISSIPVYRGYTIYDGAIHITNFQGMLILQVVVSALTYILATVQIR